MKVDVNDLAYWFPPLERAGLPVPKTQIVRAGCDLSLLLDGEEPPCWDRFIFDLGAAVEIIGGAPFFLRTGHGSGKHEWCETCYVDAPDDRTIGQHVAALVEWSHTINMWGLPHETWAVRELIPTTPLFTCRAWGDFPVTREFRVFIRGDEIEEIYRYWPTDAIVGADPDRDDWAELLGAAGVLSVGEIEEIATLAGEAAGAIAKTTGDEAAYWSIDFLEDKDGRWWLTDMADGARSYRPGVTP